MRALAQNFHMTPTLGRSVGRRRRRRRRRLCRRRLRLVTAFFLSLSSLSYLPIYQKAGFFFFLFFFFCCCVHTCFTCVRLRLRVPKMKPSAAVSFSRPTLRDSRRVVDTTPFWGGRGAHNNRAPQKAYWVFYTNNNSNSNFYFFSTSSSSREREFVPHRSSFLLLSSSKQQKKMSTQITIVSCGT